MQCAALIFLLIADMKAIECDQRCPTSVRVATHRSR